MITRRAVTIGDEQARSIGPPRPLLGVLTNAALRILAFSIEVFVPSRPVDG